MTSEHDKHLELPKPHTDLHETPSPPWPTENMVCPPTHHRLTPRLTPPVERSYWFYAPNHGAAIFFTLAFLSTTILHFWQC